MNKPKTLISLAILPVVALAGCDGSYKTKVAPSSKTTTKNSAGAYQKCDPNKTDCNGSSGGGTAGGYSGYDDGKSGSKSGKSSAKGGFGGSAGHSGG